MTTNYDVLSQKFANFKNFMKEHAKDKVKASLFSNYSDEKFLGYSAILFAYKEKGKLDEIVDKTIKELDIDVEHFDKIKRYYLCFIEYLEKMADNNEKTLIEKKNNFVF